MSPGEAFNTEALQALGCPLGSLLHWVGGLTVRLMRACASNWRKLLSGPVCALLWLLLGAGVLRADLLGGLQSAKSPGTASAEVIPPGATVVTFAFADTKKSQTRVGPLFARYGMHSTFYLSSGRIGHGSGYLSLADVRTLVAAGHEMASHTIDHVNLERVSLEEARHQICDDRANLMAMGLSVSSFSYPFGADTPEARQVLIDCNFTNAQSTGGLRNPHSCAACPPVETIPPLDGFRIRSPPSIKSDWTLRDLQELVLQAEATGGRADHARSHRWGRGASALCRRRHVSLRRGNLRGVPERRDRGD